MYIGEFAKNSGVSRDTIRHYLELGLIFATRDTANGYQVFSADMVQRLHFIRTARCLGFHLEEVGRILNEAQKGRSPCTEVRTTIRQRISETRQKIVELEQQCARMQSALDEWEGMRNGIPRGDSICRLIESQGSDKSPSSSKTSHMKLSNTEHRT